MANHYETSPPMFRNAPLKFIVYILLIPVFRTWIISAALVVHR